MCALLGFDPDHRYEVRGPRRPRLNKLYATSPTPKGARLAAETITREDGVTGLRIIDLQTGKPPPFNY